MAKKTSDKTTEKTINLALQGGGTHGAYAWGVLDYLLEDGRIDIEGISATSAGAMNACALAYGLHKGGRESARETLYTLWNNIYHAGLIYSPVRGTQWKNPFFPGLDYSPSYMAFDMFNSLLSPYQFNPFDINPLRDIAGACIDFDDLRACQRVKLFISATHVASGKVRIFNTDEISLDVVMASAALPELFKAVEIDGEHYWDGGYTGNPSLFPLFYHTDCRDIMIVHINPLDRPQLPKTATEIINRVNEISFNSSLLLELRSIAFVKKLLADDMIKDEYKDRYKDVLMHSIRADKALCDLSVASKFDTDWDFLVSLKNKGRHEMKTWLEKNFDNLGQNSTVDLKHDLLDKDHKEI